MVIFYNSLQAPTYTKSITIDVKIYNNEKNMNECTNCTTKTGDGYSWSFYLPIEHKRSQKYTTVAIGSENGFKIGTLRYEFYYQGHLLYSSNTFQVLNKEDYHINDSINLNGKTARRSWCWSCDCPYEYELYNEVWQYDDGGIKFTSDNSFVFLDDDGNHVMYEDMTYSVDDDDFILHFRKDGTDVDYSGKFIDSSIIFGEMENNYGTRGCFVFNIDDYQPNFSLIGKSYEWHFEWDVDCDNTSLRKDGYVTFSDHSRWIKYYDGGDIKSKGSYEFDNSVLILTFDSTETVYTGSVINQNMGLIKGTMKNGVEPNIGQRGCFEFILK